MGYYKDIDIDEQEAEQALEALEQNRDEFEEEFHFYHTLNHFSDLVTSYGADQVVKSLSPELRFDLLEAIIKSQGNTRN